MLEPPQTQLQEQTATRDRDLSERTLSKHSEVSRDYFLPTRTLPKRRLRPWLARQTATFLCTCSAIDAAFIFAMLGIVGLLLASHMPMNEDGDGLLTTIISLHQVTLYYWLQDRLGNLLPAMTMWIHDPTNNAYAQVGLRLIFGLLAPIFYCSLVFPRAVDSWRAVLATDLLLVIALSPGFAWQIYIEAYPYGTALAMAGFSTLLLRAARNGKPQARWLFWSFGIVTLLIAYITDIALLLVAVPLIALLALLLSSEFFYRLLFLHVLAIGVGFVLPKVFAPGLHTPLGVTLSYQNGLHFLQSVWSSMGWRFTLVAVLPVFLWLGLAGLGCLRGRWLYSSILAAMLTVSMVSLLVTASSQWVAMNGFLPRYFIPGHVLLMSMSGTSLWLCCRFGISDRSLSRAAFIGISGALLLAGATRLHAWRPDGNGIIGNGKGPQTRAIAARYVAEHLDAIAGNYGDTWPAVFGAQQYEYDLNQSGQEVFGITFRGQLRRGAFAARLAKRGEMRVGCIDLKMDACSELTKQVMDIPNLSAREFAASERIPGNHVLAFIVLRPTGQ